MKLTPEQEAEFRKWWDSKPTFPAEITWTNIAMAGFAAGLAAMEPETETGWLVENGKQGDELRYRTWRDGNPAWTADHNEATRYCRRIDAEQVHREDEDAWRIVQHAWNGKPAPINSPAESAPRQLGSPTESVLGVPGADGLMKDGSIPSGGANTEGAAQSQEPVAWMHDDCGGKTLTFFEPKFARDNVVPLYTHPLANRPEGWKMVPDSHNMTDEQAEAIANIAGCCGGVAHSIYAAALAAAPNPPAAPNDAEITPLMRFYGVDDLAALVRAQEQHIQRLQSKLPAPRDEFPPSPRIG